MPLRNDATASYLGYVFQGQYALIALWDAEDDDAAVSVETADDVVLDGNDPRLAQLKHSTSTPAPLTITNVGFWKTVRIWAAHLRNDPTVRADDSSSDRTKYLFVTVAQLPSDDALASLVHGSPRTDSALDVAVNALVAEATRVSAERAASAAAKEALPHADRVVGCVSFLALSDGERRQLVRRIEILPGNFRITDVTGEVERRLRLAGSVRAAIRTSMAERLIERWDRQVTLALMGRRPRAISRNELLGVLEDLIREHGTTALPNDFGARLPDAEEYAAAEGSVLERQILLVNGGTSRVQRAVRDRWRARNQRRRWTDDDASLVLELKTYDDLLKGEWSDRHGPMCDDCIGKEDGERCRLGLDVLEWAHSEAPAFVRPPRPDWSEAFYVRGMLQQFADELEVGWHPDFLQLLGAGQLQTAASSALTGATSVATSAVPKTDRAGSDASTTIRTPTGTMAPPVDLRDQLPSELPVPPRPDATAVRRVPRARRSRPASTE